MCKRATNYTCKTISRCVCVCVYVCVYISMLSEYNGYVVVSSVALVYVYTTYLEEFASVLACI